METREIRNALRQAKNKGDSIETIMQIANDRLECHGIEDIIDNADELVAEYVNTGDTYCRTLIYDHMTGRYCIESMGDFIERKERARYPSRNGFIAK